MPNIAVREMAAYATDLGTTIENFGFKIRADKADGPLNYTLRASSCSGGGSLVKPRALVAEYADGSKIRYPIPQPNSTLIFAATAVLIGDGAVCVHLEGEEWTQIPPNIVGVTAVTRTAYDLPTGFTEIQTGSFLYLSDGLGAVNPRYKMEQNPPAIFQAAKGCLSQPVVGTFPCAINNVIKPRELSVVANKNGGGLIVRKTHPASVGNDVFTCAASLFNVGFCVKYKGESIRNIQAIAVAP
jgi:hypothetical protein